MYLVNAIGNAESPVNTTDGIHGMTDILGGSHVHVGGTRERVWLESIPDEPSTMDLHTYCAVCGRVRQKKDHGKQPSFFVESLSRLMTLLHGRERIVEAQARLIVRKIMSDDTICDTYSSSYSLQAERYVEIVRSYRPDLDDMLILRSTISYRKGKKGNDDRQKDASAAHPEQPQWR
ncbi:MAG: hypothetical protein KIS30_02455 [Thermoplasmata archaeon]|nr:hypothetical protein [Candidatus Sysuiplasma acidicola]